MFGFSEKKKEKFTYSVEGIVWKIFPDLVNENLLVEVRNEATRQATFMLIDIDKQKIVFKEYIFEETWWIAVSLLINDTAFLYEYTDSQNPTPKNTIAFDVKKRAILWKKENATFLQANTEKAIVYQYIGDEKIEENIQIKTGASLPVSVFNQISIDEKQLMYPSRYFQNEPYFDTVATFLRNKFKIEALHVIDYLQTQTHIVVSFYIAENQKLTHNIMLLDIKGNLQFEQKIGEQLTGIGSDSFIFFRQNLIFVKNKNEIITYSVAGKSA